MKIFYYFICLFVNVKLANYISFKLNIVDDCLRELKISDKVLFTYNPEYNPECGTYTWPDRPDCDSYNDFMYPSDKFIIKNYEYDFKTPIIVTFEDYNHMYGYMNMTVYFNEYTIETKAKRFWRCINCGEWGIGNQDYFYNRERINFYKNDRDGTQCSHEQYIFIFQINEIEDLYKGGEDGPFEVKSDFYDFISNKELHKTVYNSNEDIILELINFREADILHVKTNPSLPINYENYYFKIEYEDYYANGELNGINYSNGLEKRLSPGDTFIVTNTSGLNYKLREDEKINKRAFVKVKITPFNKCPVGYEYNCNSKPIASSGVFTIFIDVIDPPTTIPVTERPVDTTEQTSTISDTQQTQPPSDIVMSTSASIDTTQQASTPSHTAQQTQAPSDITQEALTPSHTTQQTQTPSDTIQKTSPSVNIEQTQTPSDNAQQTLTPSDNT